MARHDADLAARGGREHHRGFTGVHLACSADDIDVGCGEGILCATGIWGTNGHFTTQPAAKRRRHRHATALWKPSLGGDVAANAGANPPQRPRHHN